MNELTLTPIHIHEGPSKEITISVMDLEDYNLSRLDKIFMGFQMNMFKDNLSFEDESSFEFEITEYKGKPFLKPLNQRDEYNFNNYGSQTSLKMSFNAYMFAVNITAFNWMIWVLAEQDEKKAREYQDDYENIKESLWMLNGKDIDKVLRAID